MKLKQLWEAEEQKNNEQQLATNEWRWADKSQYLSCERKMVKFKY